MFDFLALVVQNQRYSYNRAPVFSGVSSLAVLRNLEANKREILCRCTYPPYLHAFFFFFQNVEIWNFKDFFSFH